MKNLPNIYTVDEKGHPVLKDLLQPFFTSLSPAFLDHAEKIEIRANLSSNVIEMNYSVGADQKPLSPDSECHPFIASSRIRMISGMSISTEDGPQYGKFRIFIGTKTVEIDSEIDVKNDLEILRLTPRWM